MAGDSPPLKTRPGMRYLDARRLLRALRSGGRRIVEHSRTLNRINVYPVPDGDTGTNLAFTIGAIVDCMPRARGMAMPGAMALVSEAAVDGARGNSGALLAQFLSGFADAMGQRARCGLQEFCAAFRAGSDAARSALAQPVEGTMLSVLAAAAEALEHECRQGVSDFREAWPKVIARARDALHKTTEQLPALRQAQVVDAGALGFWHLLDGASLLPDRQSDDAVGAIAESRNPAPLESYAVGQADHRFCSECLINGGAVERSTLVQRLRELDCSSLVVAGTHNKIRVHAHVNDPEKLFAVCESLGTVVARKADDMHRQQRSARQGQGKVAVLVDSGADIPEPLLESLDIHVVPVRVNFGQEDFLDKVTLSPQQFYQRLRTGSVHPQTSQPPPGDFRRQFSFLSAHHEAIVSISVSRQISGTFQAAQTAAANTQGADVRVLDSANMAAGQGLLAVSAAEAVQAGFDADLICRYLGYMGPRTRTYALIDELRYGVRGGRIPSVVKKLADGLHLAPILGNRSGRVGLLGVLLRRREMQGAFARFLCRRMPADQHWRVFVTHGDCLASAERLLQLLQSGVANLGSSWLGDTGTALGAHTGPGALVVGVQEIVSPRRWRQQVETMG